MRLRDEIAEIVVEYAIRREMGHEHPTEDATARHILALIEAKLTSDEALDVVMETHLQIRSPYGKSLYREDVRQAMAAALDAVSGDSDDTE